MLRLDNPSGSTTKSNRKTTLRLCGAEWRFSNHQFPTQKSQAFMRHGSSCCVQLPAQLLREGVCTIPKELPPSLLPLQKSGARLDNKTPDQRLGEPLLGRPALATC